MRVRSAMLVGMAFLHVISGYSLSTAQVDPSLQKHLEAAGVKGAGNDAKEAARHAVKVVLEKAKRWASPKPPDECSEYDFVIDIPDVASIQYGWPLNFSSPTVYSLLTKPQGQATKRLSIVALLVYYSKGKSFVLNQL
jgi:hypothetical protein